VNDKTDNDEDEEEEEEEEDEEDDVGLEEEVNLDDSSDMNDIPDRDQQEICIGRYGIVLYKDKVLNVEEIADF